MAQYATGRVEPKNQDELYKQSWKRYGHYLKALPGVTAEKWDCRTLGIVGHIKDQGSCGSCWDFAGTGICESAMIKAGLGGTDSFILSEQYTLDCGENGGCNGDDHSSVFNMCKEKGLPLTSEYGPYRGRPSSCRSGVKLYKISDWGYCGEGRGVAPTQSIKDTMVSYGPISVAIAADNAFMNITGDEVFDGNSRSVNHEVILVGWDDSKGAWILRNSWTTSWADNGYCWIKYGANSVGTEAAWVTLPPQTISWDM